MKGTPKSMVGRAGLPEKRKFEGIFQKMKPPPSHTGADRQRTAAEIGGATKFSA